MELRDIIEIGYQLKGAVPLYARRILIAEVPTAEPTELRTSDIGFFGRPVLGFKRF